MSVVSLRSADTPVVDPSTYKTALIRKVENSPRFADAVEQVKSFVALLQSKPQFKKGFYGPDIELLSQCLVIHMITKNAGLPNAVQIESKGPDKDIHGEAAIRFGKRSSKFLYKQVLQTDQTHTEGLFATPFFGDSRLSFGVILDKGEISTGAFGKS
ncbi:MAG: hypothetical protein ACI9BD_001444, partial [Candidatus Marinamargulisbacteria bacterium]